MQLNQELRDSLRTDALDVLGDPAVASIEDSARSAAIDLLRQDEAQACVVPLAQTADYQCID